VLPIVPSQIGEGGGSSSITKVDGPNSPGRPPMDVPFSATISYLNVFASGSYSGLKSSITAKSCLYSTSSWTTRATLGGSTAKLFAPVLQLPIKSVVSIDSTILFGLSENNIVLSETLPNSSVEVVAFTSDTDPDAAPWINKNVAPVILLLLLPFAFAAAVSFASEVIVVADTIFVAGNSREDETTIL
jgi:hypothetical protein